MKKLSFLILLALLCPFSIVLAQDLPAATEEENAGGDIFAFGDQTFTINAGVMFPLFFQSASDGSVADSTNLTIGIGGSLDWNTFISNQFTLGVDAGAYFSFSPNARTLVMVPLTLKAGYWLHLSPFHLVFSLAPGVNLCKLEDDYYFGPILAPEFNALWRYNTEWGFGANLKYMWIPQLYFQNGDLTSQSMLGNFLSLTLSAQYYF